MPSGAGLSGRVIGKEMRQMTRPRYQQGSLLIRGKRKKMYVARYYEDAISPDGRPLRVRRSVVLGPVSEIGSRRAAQAKFTELLRPINRGWQKPKAMLTFGEFVMEQWQPKALCLYKLSTQIGYRPLLSRHLVPYFGDRPLSEITPAQVQGFLSEKAKTEISWYAVRNLRNLLSRILRTAVEWATWRKTPRAAQNCRLSQFRRLPTFFALNRYGDSWMGYENPTVLWCS